MNKLAAVLALVFAACGGGGSLSIDEYPQGFREAFCQNFIKCGVVKDLNTCLKLNFGADLQLNETFLAAFDGGKAKFNSDKGRACIDGIAGASCDATDESQRSGPVECSQILTGTLSAGQACTVDAECISQDCQRQNCNMACCPGACSGDPGPAIAKVGESCHLDTARCASGTYCNRDTEICTALQAAGGTCQAQEECGYGLACIGNGSTPATCTKLPHLGEACTSFCTDFGSVCDLTSKMCVKVALDGEACAANPAGSTCSPLYACAGGRCSPGTPLGAACVQDRECADFRAFCDFPDNSNTGTCTLPKANGGTCVFNSDCQSFVCDPATFLCITDPVCM